jgi:hypothetical protein
LVGGDINTVQNVERIDDTGDIITIHVAINVVGDIQEELGRVGRNILSRKDPVRCS